MPYIAPEVVQEVKQMDLLTYLKNYEPYELVHFSGNTYTTKSHDSLKISNGKWMWWSRGIGGRSALDYLIKVRDYTFMEAVETLVGLAGVKPPVPLPIEKQTKKLLLPEPCRYQTRVVSYLRGRGIDGEIVDFCLRTGRVYESGRYHNAVFVGRDRESGAMPKFSLCSDGVKWFQEKGQFKDGSCVPVAGDIIFFDWGDDGSIDHVGFVESVGKGKVNTVEGNSGEQVKRHSYPIGDSRIYGYGILKR